MPVLVLINLLINHGWVGLAVIFLVANFGDFFKQGIFHRIYFFQFSFFWQLPAI